MNISMEFWYGEIVFPTAILIAVLCIYMLVRAYKEGCKSDESDEDELKKLNAKMDKLVDSHNRLSSDIAQLTSGIAKLTKEIRADRKARKREETK